MTKVDSSKLLPEYMGLFRVLRQQGNVIELPRRRRTHPTFYVGFLRPYCQYEPYSDDEDISHVRESTSYICARAPDGQSGRLVKRPQTQLRNHCELSLSRQQGIGHPARPEDVRRCNQHDQIHDPISSFEQNRSDHSVYPSRDTIPRATYQL